MENIKQIMDLFDSAENGQHILNSQIIGRTWLNILSLRFVMKFKYLQILSYKIQDGFLNMTEIN